MINIIIEYLLNSEGALLHKEGRPSKYLFQPYLKL